MTDQITQLKTKAKAVWATGSYNEIAQFVPPAASHLVDLTRVREADRVLDVATGTGVTAITARRAGAEVVGLDLTPELLAVAQAEERLAGTNGIQWREGDAEALPFPDGSFDVVLSSFGHMFAPRPETTLNEMMRVLRPGGRIGFVTHFKGNVAQAFFGAIAKHVPAPTDSPPSPFLWGDTDVVRERMVGHVEDLVFEEGALAFPALSPGHFWRLFSTKYGPTMKALESLGTDDGRHRAFQKDFVDAVAPYWSNGTMEMAYLITHGSKA